MKVAAPCAAVLPVLLICALARAEEKDEPRRLGGRTLALGAGEEHGFQVQARARLGSLSLEATLGTMPYLEDSATSADATKLELRASLRTTGSAILMFNDAMDRYQSGIRLGGVWDSLRKGGVILGYVGELNLTRRLALALGVGLGYYPRAGKGTGRELREAFGETTANVGATLAKFQAYGGVSLLVYLF